MSRALLVLAIIAATLFVGFWLFRGLIYLNDIHQLAHDVHQLVEEGLCR